MQRLSGLDASSLYLETRSQLMHVTGLLEIDPTTTPGDYSFLRLRDELERRIAAMPQFRRKLRNSLLNVGHPVWVEHDAFDIERHVHWVAVPSPGGAAEMADLCGHLASQTLDRGKPLWETVGDRRARRRQDLCDVADAPRQHRRCDQRRDARPVVHPLSGPA